MADVVPNDQEGAEFAGSGDAGQPGFVPLPSRAIMDHVKDVAGRVGGHGMANSPYRNITGYVPGQVETFDMVNAVDLDRELGFPCHSIIADNPTKQWIFIPSAQRWLPPGVIGYVMQVPKAATKAQARWRAPDTLAQPAIGTAITATLTFCEAFLMPSPGFIPVAGGV